VFRGLRGEFKDLVTSLVTKAEPLSYANIHSHLLTHEFLQKNSLHSINANSSLMSSPLCRSHHYCQHHYLLLILLHLITSLILVVTEGVFVATSVPTATVTIIKTGPQLLPSGGRTTGSRIGTIHGLDSSMDNRMSSVNYDQPSATQLHIVPSFTVVPNNPLLILLLGTFLPLLGSRTSV